MKAYGQVGTNLVVQGEIWSIPSGYVELVNTEPPTSFHVLDESGVWILPKDVNIDTLRAELYIKAWPSHKQLEAIQDNANGDPTKLNKMNAEFDAIKKAYPKKKLQMWDKK